MIGFIVFGLVVGVLARFLVPGRQHLSLLMTLLLGLVGSVIGGVVANSLGTGDVMELNFLGAVVAIIAAIVLIVIGENVGAIGRRRSEEHTSELQSLMRISYAVFCLKKKTTNNTLK